VEQRNCDSGSRCHTAFVFPSNNQPTRPTPALPSLTLLVRKKGGAHHAHVLPRAQMPNPANIQRPSTAQSREVPAGARNTAIRTPHFDRLPRRRGACARGRRTMQEAATSSSPLPSLSNGYQPLPPLYLGFLAIWAASGFSWAFTTWRNRHYHQVLSFPSSRRDAQRVLHLCFVCWNVVCRSKFSGRRSRNLAAPFVRTRMQANNLQWILSLVPLIKALQMALSFLFW
jgi:hypothetical protein